jgi:hypothetical protein
MTKDIFREIFSDVDLQIGRQNCKILILLDNAACHDNKMETKNIKFAYLPPNTISRLQSLDAGIINNFKTAYKKMQYKVAAYRYASMKVPNEKLYDLDQYNGMRMITTAWRDVSPLTIANCFKHTGLMPTDDFDRTFGG